MDWLLLLGLLVFLVVGATAAFYWYGFVARTREEFRAAQPDLRITNMSAMSSGNVLTIYPELENVGGGVAYDCLLGAEKRGYSTFSEENPRRPPFRGARGSATCSPPLPAG